MNVGDLVQHTKSKKLYLVVKIKYRGKMIGVLVGGETCFFIRRFLEVINESR